jgi:hypothetical protein
VAIDTFSPNRNYTLPATGNDVNSWGPLINANFSAIDSNISASLQITTTGGTTTLTTAQAANLFYNVNGALTSNAIIVFPGSIQTFFMVSNNTTGAFTLTIQTANTGTTQILNQGSTALYYSDGTNIIFVAGTVPTPPVPVLVTTAATTLTTNQSGFLIEMQGSSTYTVTLPTAVGNGGLKYLFFANGANQTLSSGGGLFAGPNGNLTASLTVANGSTIFVVSDGANYVTTNLAISGGYAPIAGSASQTFSVATATAATQAPQLGQILGGNASWNNVTTSRSLGGTFTNNNGKPISVSVVAASQTTAANTLNFFVNGILIGGTTAINNLGNPMGGNFIVPPGSTYMIQQAQASILSSWFELF